MARPAAWAGSPRSTALLILAVTVLRLTYLAFLCPYALVEDEAHYWEWSRHPDWSYYSKGPGVAWVIAASCRTLGDSEFAVRVPAAIAWAVAAAALASLAAAIYRDQRVAFFTAACFALVPAYQISALIMTIDIPYFAGWSLAALAAWHALARGSRAAWPLMGLAIGVGALFKYTILLQVVGLACFALLTARSALPRPRRLGLLTAAIAAGAAASPIVIWNHANGWPTFAHLLGHAALPGGDMPEARIHYDPMWTLELIGSQLAFVGPALALIAWSAGVAFHRPRADERRTGHLFLVCIAAPVLVFHLLLTTIAEAEANWPLAGYLTLLPLAAWGLVDALDHARRGDAAPPRRFPHRLVSWRLTLAIGLVSGLGSLKPDWIARVPAVGTLIPYGRIAGATAVADDAARLAALLRAETSLEPIYFVQHYGRASQLAFYIPGHPDIICTGSLMGGRHSQYDYWPESSHARPDLLGRPGILIGATLEQWQPAFDSVDLHGVLAGEHKPDRLTFLGRGYRGFSPPPHPEPDP